MKLDAFSMVVCNKGGWHYGLICWMVAVSTHRPETATGIRTTPGKPASPSPGEVHESRSRPVVIEEVRR